MSQNKNQIKVGSHDWEIYIQDWWFDNWKRYYDDLKNDEEKMNDWLKRVMHMVETLHKRSFEMEELILTLRMFIDIQLENKKLEGEELQKISKILSPVSESIVSAELLNNINKKLTEYV